MGLIITLCVFVVIIASIGALIELSNSGCEKWIKDGMSEKILDVLYKPLMDADKETNANRYFLAATETLEDVAEFLENGFLKEHRECILWQLGYRHKALSYYSFYEKVKHLA